MSDLRALVREILAEEIAFLRAELAPTSSVEQVKVVTAEDLKAFALSVLRRAEEPGFAKALAEGQIRFEPIADAEPVSIPSVEARPATKRAQPAVLVTSVSAGVPELRKGLISERDISDLPSDETRLRIAKGARLTPLASDEARRRGLRIERIL